MTNLRKTNEPRTQLHFASRLVFTVVLTFSALLAHPDAHAAGSGKQKRSTALPPPRGDSTIAFVSDTQQPIFFEKFAIAGNNNERATQQIFSQILEERPNAVVHLGDMVSFGFDSYAWAPLDSFNVGLWRRHIPMYPTLGNHELLLYWKHGESAFTDRFPFYKKTGYVVRVGRLAVLLLNSNLSRLSTAEKTQQETWYAETLAKLAADSSVGMIAVGCHHSPFTNSTIVDPDEGVQKAFLPLFFKNPKCRIFISGHAHASEHFRINGRDFLVLGGGGGLQQPLLTGTNQRYEDLAPMKSAKRMFHYVAGKLTRDGATFTVRMLNEDFSGFQDAFTITLPWQ